MKVYEFREWLDSFKGSAGCNTCGMTEYKARVIEELLYAWQDLKADYSEEVEL